MSQFCVAGLAAAGAVLLLPDRHDLGADRDGVTDAAHDRALVSMEAGHSLHHGQVHIGVHGEQVADMDPLRPRCRPEPSQRRYPRASRVRNARSLAVVIGT